MVESPLVDIRMECGDRALQSPRAFSAGEQHKVASTCSGPSFVLEVSYEGSTAVSSKEVFVEKDNLLGTLKSMAY